MHVTELVAFPSLISIIIATAMTRPRLLFSRFNIFMYVPYRGTELYDLCQKNGLLPDRAYSDGINWNDESTLNFSKEYKKELVGLMKTFNLYIKLPEKYYPQIKIAERSDEEGQAMFKQLSQLLE